MGAHLTMEDIEDFEFSINKDALRVYVFYFNYNSNWLFIYNVLNKIELINCIII